MYERKKLIHSSLGVSLLSSRNFLYMGEVGAFVAEGKFPQNFPSSPSFSFLSPPSFSSSSLTLYVPRPLPFMLLEPHPKAYLLPLSHLLLLTPFLFL